MKQSHPVADYMHAFFYQYLAEIRGLSSNTVFAYRDTIKLLLCFCADRLRKEVDQLNIEEINDKIVLTFLNNIETNRGCTEKTRNARLAGIRAFFGFISREEPVLLKQCYHIRAIPLKRTEHKTVDYLDNNEMKAILGSTDSPSHKGIRNKALFMILYNTGARVGEIVNLKINDLRLDSPGQVSFLGKGKKQRACPLWAETIESLNNYLKIRQPQNPSNEHLFLNDRGKPITRFGIGHIINKYAQKASQICPSLNHKSVGPHTFRHSTAMHLIQAGNDINMVKLWLGHADINTTHMYVEINMEMKRKILNTTQSPTTNTKKNKLHKWQKPDILKWLDELSKNPGLC